MAAHPPLRAWPIIVVAMLMVAVVVLILLAGCAHTVPMKPACLPMATISAADQQALAQANSALDAPAVAQPTRDALRAVLKDYIAMRAANRAACS